jgi:hypothetical protein
VLWSPSQRRAHRFRLIAINLAAGFALIAAAAVVVAWHLRWLQL